jgi:hypothetical protein
MHVVLYGGSKDFGGIENAIARGFGTFAQMDVLLYYYAPQKNFSVVYVRS